MKACPFCGRRDLEVIPVSAFDRGVFAEYRVRCGYCGAEGETCNTKQGARKAWDTRTPEK